MLGPAEDLDDDRRTGAGDAPRFLQRRDDVADGAAQADPRLGGVSQYYVEPKRLAKLGYLEAHQEPGRTRPRTVYSLTEKGLAALRDWAATPVTLTPLKSEVLLRLLIADLVGDEVTRASVATLRDDLEDIVVRLDESAAAAEALPHRRTYLLLVNDFLRRLVALHGDLIDDVERELS